MNWIFTHSDLCLIIALVGVPLLMIGGMMIISNGNAPEASDEQIAEWIADDPDGVIAIIEQYKKGILAAAWVDTHEDEIEREWDARGEEE